MAWLKKSDPISERARALNTEIAALESQIKQLDAQLHQGTAHPRLRSTAVPRSATLTRTQPSMVVTEPAPVHTPEPVFEEVDQKKLKADPVAPEPASHYNELGVRKYDLTELWQKIKNLFHGPTTSNPRLVTYLAAGGVQGLRTLRYERRVSRNRFILLAAVLFFAGVGMLWWFLRHR